MASNKDTSNMLTAWPSINVMRMTMDMSTDMLLSHRSGG